MGANSRSAIDDALFAQLAAATFVLPDGTITWNSSSQHFQPWENYDSMKQPALFLRRILEDVVHKTYGLNKYALHYECWIYARTESNETTNDPYDIIDPLIDAVDKALQPNPVVGRNNLGGLVEEAYLNGQIAIADGTDNGQAVIRIPITVVSANPLFTS